MRSVLLRGFAAIVMTLASLSPAAAVTIDEAGAASVKAMVDDALGFYLDLHKKNGEGLTTSGPVEVTPKGAYYEVKIPGAAIASESAVMNIGTVMLNVTPKDDGDYLTSIAIPNQMAMKDKEGIERMQITLGGQKFSGVWRPELGMFTKADASYDNVVANITPRAGADGKKAEPASITMGNISSRIAMTPDGDKWSGPQTTTVSNAVVSFGPNKASKLTVEKFDAAMNYTGINLAANKKLRDELREALKSTTPGTADEARRVAAAMRGSIETLPQGGSSTFSMSNLALDLASDKTDTATPATPISLRVANVNSASTFAGMDGDNGSATAKTTLSGLSVSGSNGPLMGLIPTDAAINVTTAAVPFKSLMDAFATAMNSAIDAQAGPDGASQAAQDQANLHMQQAMATVPGILARAGTSLTIADTFTSAPDLSSKLDGNLKAVSGAPYIFAGTMTLTMTGMDELITKLQQAANTGNNPKAAGYAQMLIIMQLSGQLSKTPEGKSQRTYALELTQDGKVTLNGADMKAMIPALGTPADKGAPAESPAPAPAPAPATP